MVMCQLGCNAVYSKRQTTYSSLKYKVSFAQQNPDITGKIKPNMETMRILRVVERLEDSRMNSVFSCSNIEKLVIRLSHLLPKSMISQIPTFIEDSTKFERLATYVSVMYQNMDAALIVSTLIQRGFISIDESSNINQLKLSLILVALYKLKELSHQQDKESEISPFSIDNWAS
eukprot:gene24725-33198_t